MELFPKRGYRGQNVFLELAQDARRHKLGCFGFRWVHEKSQLRVQ
jgi:hypothetical protein